MWSLSLSQNTLFVLFWPFLWWCATIKCLPDEATWVWGGHCDRALGYYGPSDDLWAGAPAVSGLQSTVDRVTETLARDTLNCLSLPLTATTRWRQAHRSGRRRSSLLRTGALIFLIFLILYYLIHLEWGPFQASEAFPPGLQWEPAALCCAQHSEDTRSFSLCVWASPVDGTWGSEALVSHLTSPQHRDGAPFSYIQEST